MFKINTLLIYHNPDKSIDFGYIYKIEKLRIYVAWPSVRDRSVWYTNRELIELIAAELIEVYE
jgi:hypothetical protein